MTQVHLGHVYHVAGSPTVSQAAAALVSIADGALVIDDSGTIVFCGERTAIPARRASTTQLMISEIASSPAFASCRRTPPVSRSSRTAFGPPLPTLSRAARMRPTSFAPCTSPKAPPRIGALQHRAADMFVAVEQARSMSYFATMAGSFDDAKERATSVAAAKVQIGRSARYVGQQSIQLHGGIGMTMEAKIGHYFKRLTMIETLFGDADYHLRRVSDQGGLLQD